MYLLSEDCIALFQNSIWFLLSTDSFKIQNQSIQSICYFWSKFIKKRLKETKIVDVVLKETKIVDVVLKETKIVDVVLKETKIVDVVLGFLFQISVYQLSTSNDAVECLFVFWYKLTYNFNNLFWNISKKINYIKINLILYSLSCNFQSSCSAVMK